MDERHAKSNTDARGESPRLYPTTRRAENGAAAVLTQGADTEPCVEGLDTDQSVALDQLIADWRNVARSKLVSAEGEEDPTGRIALEHGALCYWHCSQALKDALQKRVSVDAPDPVLEPRKPDQPGRGHMMFNETFELRLAEFVSEIQSELRRESVPEAVLTVTPGGFRLSWRSQNPVGNHGVSDLDYHTDFAVAPEESK